jgi:hypothetical protein
VPLVHGKLAERRQETEAGLFDSMSQRASFPADAAVTEANVVEVRIDLEANLPAVARSSVGLHRRVLVLLGFRQTNHGLMAIDTQTPVPYEEAMDQSTIFAPFFAMILLTLLVWTYMYARRIVFIRRSNLSPEQLTPIELARISPGAVSNPSDNLKNLFEIPTLFYGLALYLYVTHQVDRTCLLARGAMQLLG